MLSNKKLFLFDIDGTVCQGERLIDGTTQFLEDILSGYLVGWLSVKWGKILHCTAGRKRNIHADSDAVLCSHIWSNFV